MTVKHAIFELMLKPASTMAELSDGGETKSDRPGGGKGEKEEAVLMAESPRYEVG